MAGSKKYIREMIKEAVEHHGGTATYGDIREYIAQYYPGTNENSVTPTIIETTVNQPSRIHYPSNQKPRICSDPRYDFLYTVGRGKVVLYDPEKHGIWEIAEKDGRLQVLQQGIGNGDEDDSGDTPPGETSFALESHLRDYLARNLFILEDGLKLFHDDNDREGVEYPTDVGLIDILAVDPNGDFVVCELKVGRGPDAACGQVLRYMGWVRRHLAEGRDVRGVIVAHRAPQNLLYAASEHPKLKVFEYDLSFTVREHSLAGADD